MFNQEMKITSYLKHVQEMSKTVSLHEAASQIAEDIRSAALRMATQQKSSLLQLTFLIRFPENGDFAHIFRPMHRAAQRL